MKYIFLLLVMVGWLTNLNAQDNRNLGYYKYTFLDSVISFQEGTNEYSFLWSKKQGFFWDTISHKIDCHNVSFNIFNDTKDTIYINKRIRSGDGPFLYNRTNFNDSFGYKDPLRYAVFPNSYLSIAVQLYSIENRRNFDKSLIIQYTTGGSEIKYYSLKSWGHFIKGYRRENSSIQSTENNLEDKTANKPYKAFKGQLKNNIPFDGEMEYYTSKGELLVSKQIENGEEQDGYVYKGKKVNQLDSLGSKKGLWIYLFSAASYPEFRTIKNAENLYQGINHIENYQEGVKVDTQYTFNREGGLISIIVWGAPSTLPHKIYYYPDGNISQIDSFAEHPRYAHVRSESVYYSDTTSNCIIKRETYIDQKVNFIYEYTNCQLYSKTSVKEKYFRVESQTVTREVDIVSEGSIKTVEITEELVSVPETKAIPYTVEIGVFDSTETFLVKGKINYYNSQGTLIESKEVVDGKIVE